MNEDERKIEVSHYQVQQLAGLLKRLDNWLRELVPIKNETLLNGVCPFCNKPFIRKVPYQVFCDTPCQKAFNNAKRVTKSARIMAEIEGNNAICAYCKQPYTLMPSDRGTAWAHYCPTCRTSFQPWLDAHPDYQSPSAAMDELKSLIQNPNVTAQEVKPSGDGTNNPPQSGN